MAVEDLSPQLGRREPNAFCLGWEGSAAWLSL